jgi:hypothetical protein
MMKLYIDEKYLAEISQHNEAYISKCNFSSEMRTTILVLANLMSKLKSWE